MSDYLNVIGLEQRTSKTGIIGLALGVLGRWTVSGRLPAVFTATAITPLLALSGCGAPSAIDPARPDTTVTNVGTTVPPGDGGASPRNPCTLLTAAELGSTIATVVKSPAAPTVAETAALEENQGRTCRWGYTRGPNAAEIDITAWNGRQYYTPDVDPGFVSVPGIGDAAHRQSSMFMFRKGDDVFLVSVFGDPAGEALRPAIARLIVSKL